MATLQLNIQAQAQAPDTNNPFQLIYWIHLKTYKVLKLIGT